MNGRYVGVAAAAGATVSWGAMFPVAGNLLATLDPFTMTSIRYAAAALALAFILLLREGPRAFRLDGRAAEVALLGTIGFASFNLFLYNGVRLSTIEHGALIMATTPMLATVAIALRDHRWPSSVAALSVLAALAGVAIVITHGDIRTLAKGGVGDAMIVAAALSWVTYTIGARRFSNWSPLRFTTLSAGFGGTAAVLATAVALAFGAAHLPSPALLIQDAPGMLYMVFAAAVFAVFAWNVALQRLGAASTMLFMNLLPVTAFLIAIARGANVPGIELIGAALTITALVVNNFAMRPQATQAVTLRRAPAA